MCANSYATIHFSRDNFYLSSDVTCIFRFKTSETAGGDVEIGLRNKDSTIENAKFTLNFNSGNWIARCENSSGNTTSDTGVAKDTSWHEYKIVTSSSNVKFYIDGVLKATISANQTASLVSPFVQMHTGQGVVAKKGYVDWMKLEYDRAA